MIKIRSKKTKVILYWILYISIAFVFITLIFLPKDFFDYGKPICISVNLFHKECYACGLTRATQHLLHFDFNGAAKYNRLSFITLPLIIYLVLFEFIKFKKNKDI